MREDRPVGIVTRADVESAAASLAEVAASAAEIPAALDEVPSAARDADDSLTALARLADLDDAAFNPRGAEDARASIREEGEEESANAALDEPEGRGRAASTSGAASSLAAELALIERRRRANERRNSRRRDARERMRAERDRSLLEQRVARTRALIRLARRRTIADLASRVMWGRTGSPLGALAALPRRGLRFTREVAASIGTDVRAQIRQSFPKGEEYERRLGELAARRGMLNPDRGGIGLGVAVLRNRVDLLRDAFAATGDEALGAMEALGHHLSGGSRPGLEAGTLQLARRTGMDSRHVAGGVGRMLDYVSRGRRGILDFAGGEDWLTIGRAMGSMRGRPEEFLGDVEAYAEAFGSRQGLADYRAPLGMASVFGRHGLGGAARRDVGLATIAGTAEHRSAAVLAAKIAAVRKMGPTTVGEGVYQETLDPDRSVVDALRLIESGEGRVTGAIGRKASDLASRAGGGDAAAKPAFGGMTGLSAIRAEKVWSMRDDIESAIDTTGGEPGDEWQQGPIYRGGEASISGAGAKLDAAQHAAGKAVLAISHELKDALLLILQGFGNGDVLGRIGEAAMRLSPNARGAILLNTAVQPGGARRAAGLYAAMEVTRLGRALQTSTRADYQQRIEDIINARNPPPAPAAPAELTMGGLTALGAEHGATGEDMVLAIMANSEAANRGEAAAVMHTAFNRVARGDAPNVGAAILGPAGTTGDQGRDERQYATNQIPTGDRLRRMLDVAREVRAARERGEDPTGGATHFMHPETQRTLHERNPRRWTRSPEDVDRDWTEGGYERVQAQGVNNDRIWLYQPQPRPPRRGRGE